MTIEKINLFQADSMILMADFRFCNPDYINDQVWNFSLGIPSIKALIVETTFGIRANWMRFFPRFHSEHIVITDPEDYTDPVVIDRRYLNYLKIRFSPINNLETTSEYWIPDSHSLAGRFLFKNTGKQVKNFIFEWVGMFNPIDEGVGLHTIQKDSSCILQGLSGSLAPVCFLSGGPLPGNGSLPSLQQNVTLEPGEIRIINWANATLLNSDSSFNHARSLTASSFDAEFARIERINAWKRVEIQTGNPHWDNQIHLTQDYVYGMFFPGNQNLPNPSFVLLRNPDLGYTYKGNGTDYPNSWSGQSLLDSYFIAGVIPPNDIKLIEGLIENFLHVQEETGFIDGRPGLAGQRGKFLAPPLLATLAVKTYYYNQDKKWLEKIYPGLLKFLFCWFDGKYDKDSDGIPEWQSIHQTGLEYHPMLDPWDQDSAGFNITYMESPALAAFLLKECRSLVSISQEINDQSVQSWLEEKISLLNNCLFELWSVRTGTFRYRDFESHNQNPGTKLLAFQGPGEYFIKRKELSSDRLHISISNTNENTRALIITISGADTEGKASYEKVTPKDLNWIFGKASYTSKNLYSRIDQISVASTQLDIRGTLSTVDTRFEDISSLLPVWAIAKEEGAIRDKISNRIKKHYINDYGLASYSLIKHPAPKNNENINPIHNMLIMEGLLNSNHRDLVGEVLTNYLNSLKPGGISQIPSPWDSGMPKLVPIEIFLKTIGIIKLTPEDIILEGYSPFLKPITVKYEGLTITVSKNEYEVTSPDGQSVKIIGPGAHRVKIE